MVSEMAGFSLGGDYEWIAKLWLCTKSLGLLTVSSAVCCELWKLRNVIYVLSGCGLEEHGTSVEFDTADAQVLERARASEDGSWFRRCAHFSGEAGHEANADRTCP
jgi:hypothetical protein